MDYQNKIKDPIRWTDRVSSGDVDDINVFEFYVLVLEKLKAARKANIKIIVIEKPKVEYDIEFNDEKSLVDYLADKYNLK